jgi:hypothetical protein
MTRGWAEKQRLGDLSFYAGAEGSDIEQFASFDEEAKNLLEGRETAKIRPQQTSKWFAETSAEILAHVGEAETRIGGRRSKEFHSTVTDLKILAQLALYHARRIPAAVSYRLFERTGDAKALDDAIMYEHSAIGAWRQLVAAAGDAYTHDLMMGVRGAGLCGHWTDELAALEKGLAALERKRRDHRPAADVKPAPRYRPVVAGPGDHEPPSVVHQPVVTAPAGKTLVITAEVRDPSGIRWARLRYRRVNQHQDYRTLPMLPTGGNDRYRAVIPAEEVVPAWDLMYFIEAMDRQGNGRIYPDLNRETPYFVVRLAR